MNTLLDPSLDLLLAWVTVSVALYMSRRVWLHQNNRVGQESFNVDLPILSSLALSFGFTIWRVVENLCQTEFQTIYIAICLLTVVTGFVLTRFPHTPTGEFLSDEFSKTQFSGIALIGTGMLLAFFGLLILT